MSSLSPNPPRFRILSNAFTPAITALTLTLITLVGAGCTSNHSVSKSSDEFENAKEEIVDGEIIQTDTVPSDPQNTPDSPEFHDPKNPEGKELLTSSETSIPDAKDPSDTAHVVQLPSPETEITQDETLTSVASTIETLQEGTDKQTETEASPTPSSSPIPPPTTTLEATAALIASSTGTLQEEKRDEDSTHVLKETDQIQLKTDEKAKAQFDTEQIATLDASSDYERLKHLPETHAETHEAAQNQPQTPPPMTTVDATAVLVASATGILQEEQAEKQRQTILAAEVIKKNSLLAEAKSKHHLKQLADRNESSDYEQINEIPESPQAPADTQAAPNQDRPLETQLPDSTVDAVHTLVYAANGGKIWREDRNKIQPTVASIQSPNLKTEIPVLKQSKTAIKSKDHKSPKTQLQPASKPFRAVVKRVPETNVTQLLARSPSSKRVTEVGTLSDPISSQIQSVASSASETPLMTHSQDPSSVTLPQDDTPLPSSKSPYGFYLLGVGLIVLLYVLFRKRR